MKKIIALALTLVVVGAQTASADPLMKYTYFDAAYQWTHVDADGFDDANGLDTKLSYVIFDNVAFEGGYNYGNSEIADLDLDVSEFKYGLAAWHSFCQGFDLVGRVGGTHTEISGDIPYDRQDGVYAGAGLRTLLTDSIEGNFDALYEYGNGVNLWTYTLSAFFTLTDDIALKTAAGITDDEDVILTGGLRFTM